MRNQNGLSLVELMIAVVLGLILISGVMKIFMSSKVVFSTQQGLSRIQETGRLAIDFISRDIRMAGYYGAARANNNQYVFSMVSAPATVGLHGNFDISIRGYGASVPALPHNLVTDLGIDGVNVKLADNSSILVIRGANQTGAILTQANTANSLFAFASSAADSKGCVNNICPGSALVVADNLKAYVFQASTVSPNGNALTINHTSAWGGDVNNPLTNFGAGAEVLSFNTTVYFVATDIKTGVPALYQRINNRDPVQLLEGVENMSVTYSVTTNTLYRLASALSPADWSNVEAVRIELLVRSIDNNVVEKPQPYKFATVITNPPDKYMRQIFTTTVVPRTRMIFN